MKATTRTKGADFNMVTADGGAEVMKLILGGQVLAGLIGNSLAKGIITATLGLLFASIGSDPENYTPRLMFGFWGQFDGLALINGDLTQVFYSPVAVLLLILSVVSVFWFLTRNEHGT